jgi:PAS domain S-box-containing protein
MMPHSSRSPVPGILVAVVATGLALVFSLLSPKNSAYLFLLFLAATTFSAWYGGLRPGLIALLLGTILLAISFTLPGIGLQPVLVNVIGLVVFALVSMFVMGLLYAQEQTTRRLDEERERLHVTLASIGDAVICTDTSGTITFMNEVAIRLTGWPRDEAIGKSIDQVFRVVSESDRSPQPSPTVRALQTGSAMLLGGEVLLIARDGRELVVDDSAAPIRTADGTLIGAVLVFRDGSERRRSELAMIEANQSFQTVIDAAPLAIIVFDPEGTVRLWSPAAERIFGWTADEVIGKFLPTIPADKLEDFTTMRQTAANHQMVIGYEAQRLRKDGMRVEISFSTAALRDASGNLTGFISIADDVSEIKRAQKALRDSEQHLRNVLDSLFAFVGVLTPEGTLIEANRAALEVAGLKAEDVLGRPFDQTYWWSHSEEVQQQVREAILRGAGGISSRFDVEIRVAQDQHIMIDFMLAPMPGEHNEVRYLVPSAIDVTDRYRANERLIESEARYRAIGESIAYGVWMTDGRGKITYMSQSFLDLIGKPASEVIGHNWMEQGSLTGLSPEELATWVKGYGQRESFNTEFQVRDAQGDLHSILCRGVPIRSAAGQVTGWVGVNLDITERKKEELLNTLLQEITAGLSGAVSPEQVAQVVVNRVKDGLGAHLVTVMVLSPDGQEAHILDSQGLPPDLEEGFKRLPLDHPGALTTAMRLRQPIFLATDEEYTARFPEVEDIRTRTHSRATACAPIILGEKLIGGLGVSFPVPRALSEAERRFLISLADLTGQALERARLYEAEAEARLEAERADWLKTRFLAIVSHELRTPLTSIKGFATTLLETDVTWDGESQHDFISIINDEADKLAEMIDQLLDFSRLESGTLRIQREHTTLTDILNLALPQIQILTAHHKLDIDIGADLPGVDADRTRIGQVMTNIVGNAARYSPEGTSITLRAQMDGGAVRVDISDEGPGIPPSERETVFEAFRQGKNHPSAEVKGAGLGLAIARGILHAHQGHIWVEPKPAPGTTVCFTLPVDSGEGADYT